MQTGIHVKLVGEDGNVFNLLGICKRALDRNGKSNLWNDFYKEATSGDYYHALAVMTEWFIVE